MKTQSNPNKVWINLTDYLIVILFVLYLSTAKTKWRQFCNDLQELVEDFNFATLLRLDSRSDYSESNTTLVPRAQFVAIEVARNREGLNDGLKLLFKPKSKSD